MNSRARSSMLVLVLLTTLVSARADEKADASAAQRFAALKKLAGDWVAVGKDGKPTEQVFSSFRVTAAGTALHETVFPGSDHEMITIYHLDGDDLILTHYCTFGNQPRMRAERLHHAGTDGEIGHEMPIHHIDMDEIRPRRRHGTQLLPEPREIRRQNRRRHPHLLLHGRLRIREWGWPQGSAVGQDSPAANTRTLPQYTLPSPPSGERVG